MRPLVNRLSLCRFLSLGLIRSSLSAIVTVRLPDSSESLVGNPFFNHLLHHIEVPESSCGESYTTRLRDKGVTSNYSSWFTGLRVLPTIDVSADDADDPMAHSIARASSQAIRASPHTWSICAQLVRKSVNTPMPAQCKPLLSPDGFTFVAGCCAGFGQSPRGKDLALRVWLQDNAIYKPSIESDKVASIARAAEQQESRHAFLEADFSRLLPSGSSLDLSAATAVEVHLSPLPSLKALFSLPSSSFRKTSSNDYLTQANVSGLPASAPASLAIVPPFVIWRNATFGTLERLARTVAVAARRAERFEIRSRGSGLDASSVTGSAHEQDAQHESKIYAAVDILESGPVAEHDSLPNAEPDEEFASLSNANVIVPLHIAATDTAIIMDQMLVHLARPLLCVKRELRPARVLVLGDSHSLLFKDAASHYHDPGILNTDREAVKSDVCSLSNYQVCLSFGASAHGLRNRNSKTGTATKFETCVDDSLASPESVPDIVAIMAGEVDMRYVSVARRATKGITMLEQIQISASHLMNFVERVLIEKNRLQWHQVVLFGASLTCPRNETTEQLKELYYDLIPFDSSFAAFRYNNLLNNMCRDKGCRFADPTDDLFDYQKGQVYSFFNSDPAEMHCNLRPFFFWHRALLNAASDELQWCHSTTST